MEKAQQSQIKALIRPKKTALVLACLHEQGPMRWTDICDGITARTGSGAGERAVTRALNALVEMGLVEKVGNRLYALTPQGTGQARWAADMFNRLNQADESYDQPDADRPAE